MEKVQQDLNSFGHEVSETGAIRHYESDAINLCSIFFHHMQTELEMNCTQNRMKLLPKLSQNDAEIIN